MAKAILIFLGQVELIYKNERVASARESGKTAHRPRTLAPQVEDNLAGDFRAGTPVDELVTKYGVSRATVYRIAREHNVKNDPRRTPAPTGRGKSLTPGQIATAQRLRADGLSVRQIADAVGSSRGTVHRVLTSTTAPLELSAAVAISGTAAEALPMPASPRVAACPTCGHRPSNKHELQLHREGLETVWLLPDPAHPATAVVERWHCERCQPHQAGIVMCGLCSSTVMLGDELAASDQEPIPDAAVLWLAGHGWSEADGQWTCGTHRPRSATA
jgi:transposase